MDRKEFVDLIDKNIKLIRIENNYSQDKMAEILGISKKTLIQVEKGRSSLKWTYAVAVCAIFKDSGILDTTFGGDLPYIIQSLAFKEYNKYSVKTLGGKVWWRDIKVSDTCKIQHNIISNHYRILDKQDGRLYSSFDLEYIQKRFKELVDFKNT